jgi:phosphatidate cytidylyltransferase
LYVTVSITSLSLLRYLDRENGVWAVILVFVISWISDTAAFAVGSLLGKHKLIPEVSPKKTVEGAIGGIVFATFGSLLYGFGLDYIFENVAVNYLVLGVCGAILAVVSQLGDLVASLIKREYGVKDYGNIMPGHGGLMDRFDSVIAVSTILLIIFLSPFPPFEFI